MKTKQEAIQEIAQWVIDNRYPKSENEKVSDAEMYYTLIQLMNQVLVQPPVAEQKKPLSAGASELVNKLVSDLKSQLPQEKRVYDKNDNALLIYNLFRGSYSFNLNEFKEIYDTLCARANPK